MGFTDWFTFRTKEQKQAEARQYARWACPYGDAQREKLTELLAAILPQEGAQLGMTCYLTGRVGPIRAASASRATSYCNG